MRQSIWRLRRFAPALIVVALLACGCSRSKMPAGAPVPLKVGVLPVVSNAILAIAVAEGYFTEQGLTVELVSFGTSNDVLPGLVQGGLDAAASTLNAAMLNAIAGGARMRYTLPMTQYEQQGCSYAAYLVRADDLRSGKYSNIGAWKGATLSGSAIAVPGFIRFTLDATLRTGGLTLNDVRTVVVDSPAEGEALRTGQVDIVLTLEPWVTQIADMEGNAILMGADPFIPHIVSSLLVYGPRLLDDPDLGRRFALAFLKGVRRYSEGKTDPNVQLVSEFTHLEPELVRRMCWPYCPPDGSVNVAAVMEIEQWLVEQKSLDQLLATDRFLDTSFAAWASKALTRSQP